MRSVFQVLVVLLLLAAPAAAAPILPADLALAPQQWTIDFDVTITIDVSLGPAPPPDPGDPGDPAEPIIVTDCGALMASINAAAGQVDPFELEGSAYQQGGGCAHGVPARP